MGDVVGRLFREFAVTLAVTIVLSAVVSLTLTPDDERANSCGIRRKTSRDASLQGLGTRFREHDRVPMGGLWKFVLRYQTITPLVRSARSC